MSATVLAANAVSAVPGPRYVDPDGFFTHHGAWAPGVRLFRNLHFTAKAAFISLAFILPLAGLMTWLLMAQAQDAMQARMDATRQHVEIALGIVATAHQQETDGKVTRDQAQQIARRAVSQLRYDGKDYFFIIDQQPKMVMHPIKPELDNRDAGEIKDPTGFAPFSAMAALVRKEGKGFVSYQWPKPGSELPVDKISYVQGFEPWGWVLGTGVYVGDLRDATGQRLQWVGIVFTGALLIAGYLFLSFYRVMDGGLKETRRHLRAMTDGDLTTSPSPWGRDEAAQLMLELRAMQDSMRGIVSGVRSASHSIVHASTEIATASLDLSGRTEQTAANLEQSASAMEEIASTVKHTADNVRQAAQVASGNSQTAARGGEVIAEVVSTMEAINTSSQRISDIIGTIDGIAFQTNILALNAAVEAARAGEQGRGFAVVASEVRTLAQRSAHAAREIKALITSSVEKVESGTQVVKSAGDTMTELVDNARRMNDLLSEISTAASEQSHGVAQVGLAVAELDRMTQQNAALVEETSAAASGLRDQANGLVGEVARFRLPANA